MKAIPEVVIIVLSGLPAICLGFGGRENSFVICSSRNYTCDDGGCVDEAFFCDGKEDCHDGSDEKYCDDPNNGMMWNRMFFKRPDTDREKEVDICALDPLPPACTCKERTRVYCEDCDLPAVPFGIPAQTTVLDLSGNKIKTITLQDFRKLEELEKLVIMHSELRMILPGTFHSCKQLREVYLTGNDIGDLPDDMFPEDNVLEILDLRLNRLRILTRDYFSRLKRLKQLYLLENIIETIMPATFSSMQSLEYLNLDGNNLEKVAVTYFTGIPELQLLKLSRNRIYYTEESSFITLRSLKILDLSHNFIRKLSAESFTGLWNLTHLELQQNQIVWIEEEAFKPLQSLISLNVQKNNFRGVNSETFEIMPQLKHVYFDTFFMCALARHVNKCVPEGDGISSRDNLLESSVLRSAVWVVAVMACIGNITVLLGRVLMKENNSVHSFLIKNLSLADLLMGVYLLVLATHDLRYRGRYLSRDGEWRDSWSCDVCGVLTTVSSEASVLILTVITLDRYMCILYPLKTRRRSLNKAYVLMLTIWAGCISLAVLPVLGLRYFGNFFYRHNAVCIPLFLHEPRGDGWEYSAFIFFGINLGSFFFIVYAYMAMFSAIRRTALAIRPIDERQEQCLMKRFFFIVVTDFFCWMPIIGLKAAALAGAPIDGGLYAWVVVFILPVNCALNPLLYTLTTKLFKQHLASGLAHTVGRRRSLETTCSYTFSSIKSKAPSQRSVGETIEMEHLSCKNSPCNIYTGKMKYKYSQGRVIFPPEGAVAVPFTYEAVRTWHS